jgi:copper chaperone
VKGAFVQQTFQVPEVSCDHCKSTIEGALLPLVGVRGAFVTVPAKTVDVEYDAGLVTPDRLVDAIEEVGYEVVL